MDTTKPLVLIVEDMLDRRDWFRKALDGRVIATFADSALQGIAEIRRNQYDLIFLDHDLGPDDITGADVAACVYLSHNRYSSFFVHSINPDGAVRMEKILKDVCSGKVVRSAFGSSDFERMVMEFISGDGEAEPAPAT